jgi:hypothetical protein
MCTSCVLIHFILLISFHRGREYIDPKSFTEPTDRDGRSLGVRVFKAFTCEFGMHKSTPRPNVPCTLGLTVDLRAKIMRTTSLLDVMSGGNYQKKYDAREQADFKRKFCNEVVIAVYDKRCYSVKDLHFDKSPASLPIQGKTMSHADYFAQRKNIKLKYPNAVPMVEVLGRNDRSIYLPAELVCANELDPQLKSKLPMIASFKPGKRRRGVDSSHLFQCSYLTVAFLLRGTSSSHRRDSKVSHPWGKEQKWKGFVARFGICVE